MEDIFRFSLLRAPEASDSLTPIVVRDLPPDDDDRMVPLVQQAVRWLNGQKSVQTATVAQLKTALKLDPAAFDPAAVRGAMAIAKRRVVAELTSAVTARSYQLDGFTEAADFLTAAALFSELATSADATLLRDWISAHPIQIDFKKFLPKNHWRPEQALSHRPAVCDHFVVREELAGYEMGEIEDIKNYLKGESKNHSLRYLAVNEQEITQETETQDNRTTETATQQRSSMKSAAEKNATETMGLDARVKTEGQYGPTKVSTDIGFQYSSTKNESTQTAAEFSSEVMEKAVREVRQRELNRIVTRHRTELEEIRDHKVDNSKGLAHTVGIYHWVDSVWRATTYKLSQQRLVLEFLIPEPGAPILERSKLPPVEKDPPPIKLDENEFLNLDADTAATLAARYGAVGIKAPPTPLLSVGAPFQSKEIKDAPADHAAAVIVTEVKVPEGYVGTDAYVTVTGMGSANQDAGSNIAIDIPGHRPDQLAGNPLIANPLRINGGEGRPDLMSVVLQVDKTVFGPGSTVPIAIFTEDLRGISGTVTVNCIPTEAAKIQWKLDTVEKIAGAYRTRLEEWEARKRAANEAPAPVRPIEIDVLCRQACISGMLNDWTAWASPAEAQRLDAGGWPRAGALTGPTSALIEFVEQAFEWHNLQYVCYPFYWADKSKWTGMLDFEHGDPHVREFVRSGAARIVVPARSDLTDAVLFFLSTGLPWFGRKAPIPNEPGYLAISDEIRLSRERAPEGEVVNEFDYRLPTSLTILQESGVLPAVH